MTKADEQMEDNGYTLVTLIDIDGTFGCTNNDVLEKVIMSIGDSAKPLDY